MGIEGFNPIPLQEESKELEQPENLVVSESTPEVEVEPTKIQEKVPTSIEITGSLKRRGLDFTESLRTLNGRISRIDKEAEVISPKAIGGFKIATRNLEEVFQSQEVNLDDAIVSFGRLTTSFEDLSLMQDRDLRKITDDTRKSLVFAIEGSMDSATALRQEEPMEQLRRNINNMVNKADEAAHRLRRGARS